MAIARVARTVALTGFSLSISIFDSYPSRRRGVPPLSMPLARSWQRHLLPRHSWDRHRPVQVGRNRRRRPQMPRRQERTGPNLSGRQPQMADRRQWRHANHRAGFIHLHAQTGGVMPKIAPHFNFRLLRILCCSSVLRRDAPSSRSVHVLGNLGTERTPCRPRLGVLASGRVRDQRAQSGVAISLSGILGPYLLRAPSSSPVLRLTKCSRVHAGQAIPSNSVICASSSSNQPWTC